MKKIIQILFFLFVLSGCVDPFNPPEIEDAETLLVIDASVNGTTGIGSVKLRYSAKLNGEISQEFDQSAFVNIEGENGDKYEFSSLGSGEYRIENLALNYSERFRLNVALGNGEVYQSEFVEYIKTPAIDSVSWKANEEGIQFYVTTHDPDGKSLYYKWDYEETWEFNSAYYSQYEFVDGEIVARTNGEDLYICYRSDNSSRIVIATSEKLKEDVISNYPLAFMDASIGRFARRYSILVRQRTLTKDAYEYWESLKTNTESLGGLFDPQPYAIESNIKNITNPSESVLGYFNLYSEAQDRLFIKAGEIPYYRFNAGYNACQLDTVDVADVNPSGGYYLISGIMENGPSITAYTVATPSCVDCRYNGTSERPDFWD